ncbi:MAG: neutral/alkaline non-lysosomal ceramidase N-terminal domain-containing protein [Oscillospiraceae bacterium]|nr:neutral/alkaline non-lysosomal ceramidase N-terminal domain-containing protein [Oscillospiraceae bacterium]
MKKSVIAAVLAAAALLVSSSVSFSACNIPEKISSGTDTMSSVFTQDKSLMKIGAASVCTNPTVPIHLTGFGNIDRKYLGVHDDIEMDAVAFECEGKRSVIVAADTLGWDKGLTDQLRERIEKELGVDKNALMFNASHTHSAPNTLTNTHGLGGYVKEYSDWFYETAFQTVKAALDDLEEGAIYIGESPAKFVSINRRLIKGGVCYWQPWDAGPRNDNVMVIKAVCNDKVKAVLFNFACHPSTMNGDYITADYVGYARNYIEKKIPGTTAVFIQGCGGDLKTRALTEDGSAFKVSYEGAEACGSRLGSSVVALCNGKAGDMTCLDGSVSAKVARFTIPLQENKTTKAQYLSLSKSSTGVLPEVYTWFYENYESLPTEIPYSIQRIDFGDKFTIFALEGEAVVEYDALFKALLPDRKVMVAGYSNGEIGYICTTHMYAEGGYEPDGSTIYYGIPQGFVPEIESIIMQKASELCE